ncbi:MAG: hypothetical protein JW958_03135 [Candidatus Eisenbacteria bacterium]|nr:hypothetical protein [Candidatus Eisenbacteria bacterium]
MIRLRVRIALYAAALLAVFAAGCGLFETPSVRVLFDFEDDRDLDRVWWSCHDLFSLTAEHASSGDHALRCDLGIGDYPGVRFHGFEKNWEEYDRLAFSIFQNGADTLTLVVRIDDTESGEEFSNRYNGRFPLPPGSTEIRVPLEDVRRAPEGRLMDLSRVEKLVVFLFRPGDPPVLWLDHIRLEKENPPRGAGFPRERSNGSID